MKHRVVATLACLLALVSACSEPSPPAQAHKPSSPNGKASQSSKASPPALVEVAAVSDGSLTDKWTYLGRVEPALQAELAAAVSGHVLAVKVREGDRVKAGQMLVILDSAKLRAELAAARAKEQGLVTELELAERQFERVSKLDYPTVSAPERERFELQAASARAQLAIQRADIRRLEVEMARHSVQAPFAGVVSARLVDPGAWVNTGQAVLGLVSLDDLEVHVDVSADLGSRVEVGDSARLLGPAPIAAKVAGIVGALDASTRTMRVRLEPEERPDWLLSGMAVDVEFAVTLDGQGVLVPRDALIRGPVSTKVIKNAGGAAEPVEVTIVATAEDRTLVRAEGLAPGDQVVIRGNERLRPGQALKVVE